MSKATAKNKQISFLRVLVLHRLNPTLMVGCPILLLKGKRLCVFGFAVHTAMKFPVLPCANRTL